MELFQRKVLRPETTFYTSKYKTYIFRSEISSLQENQNLKKYLSNKLVLPPVEELKILSLMLMVSIKPLLQLQLKTLSQEKMKTNYTVYFPETAEDASSHLREVTRFESDKAAYDQLLNVDAEL